MITRKVVLSPQHTSQPGQGSHEIWNHPQQPGRRVVLSTALQYQETRVRRFRKGMMVYEKGDAR